MYTKSNQSNLSRNILLCLYFMTIFMSFFLLNSFISKNILGRVRYIIAFIFIFISFSIYLLKKSKLISKASVFFLFYNLLPYIIIFIVILIQVLLNNISLAEMKTSIVTLLYFIIPVIEMISAVYLFGKKTIDITFYATITSYTINVIVYLLSFGIKGITNFFEYGASYGSVLETHELTFCLGLFFLYYFLFEDENVRYHKFKIVIAMIYLFMGFKRIEIAALILTVIIYKIIKSFSGKSRVFIIYAIGISILITCYIYIIIIKNNGLNILAERYNINFMSRLEAYNYFKNDYSIDIFFNGNGLGYVVDKLKYADWSLYGIGDIHNDILKYYIELGFIGSLLFFSNYLIFQYKRILKKFNYKVALLYFILTIFTFIVYLTDNVSRYLQYILIYTMIPYVYSLINDKDIEEINNNQNNIDQINN